MKVLLFTVKVVGDGQNVVKLDTTLVVVTLWGGGTTPVWVGGTEEVEFAGLVGLPEGVALDVHTGLVIVQL